MLKLFLTGDNHIGLQYHKHRAAEVLIEERLKAFGTMVAEANREGCDLFVIAGDLFDRAKNIPQKTIRRIVKELAEFQGVVAILPGNHDFYQPDVPVWQMMKEETASADRIVLLQEERPYSLTVPSGEKVVLYPAFCDKKHSEPGENRLGWIKQTSIQPEDGAYHIGVAHGAVEGETIDSEGNYFPMTRDELEKIPVDVWLIGHTHVPFPRDLTEQFAPAGRIYNAGTHVQTDVSCHTEGQCFILEIGEDHTVQAKKFVPSSLRFYRENVTLHAGTAEADLDRALSAMGDFSYVDLHLFGAVNHEEYETLQEKAAEKLQRFLEAEDDCQNVSVLITKERIEKEFPETSFSAALLTALLDEPKEAQLVYDLLNSMKEGK